MQQSDYTIVDVEIGNIMEKATWDNKKAFITLIGVLRVRDGGNEVIQIVRDMPDDLFKRKVTKLMDWMQAEGHPIYALNAQFEIDSLETLTGNRYDIKEIRGHLKGHLSSKERLYGYITSQFSPDWEVYDIYDGDGKEAITDWQGYEQAQALGQSRAYFHLQNIMAHNLNCLLKENIILKHIEDIKPLAAVDEKGFIKYIRARQIHESSVTWIYTDKGLIPKPEDW